ncbi:MAG TPA: hypothetical protein VMV87_14540 [Burkholderiales bacterium]|nr:hypothetical protein [Burkholderiales bacterium]
MSADVPVAGRAPLLVLAFVSLFAGIAAGLVRLGWMFPPSVAELAALHGPLMVCGFFGTVISLERAVALGRRWGYCAPLLTGLGAAAGILGAPVAAAAALVTLGSAVMTAVSVSFYRRQRELFTLTLALGALFWLLGNLLWLAQWPIYAAVPFWIAFLVLTIAGERLELSRVLPPSAVARRVFIASVLLLLAGVVISAFAWTAGTLLLGAGLLMLALWLMRQDVARRTVKGRGLPRFIAVCLLTGYVWLALSGLVMLVSGGLEPGGVAYDAALHAVLLGFVFAMVFGHAPIILPAVLRVAVPYSPYFYLPLAFLHLSLLIRLLGDWMVSPQWRAWGGALNGVALLAFVLGTIAAILLGQSRKARTLSS